MRISTFTFLAISVFALTFTLYQYIDGTEDVTIAANSSSNKTASVSITAVADNSSITSPFTPIRSVQSEVKSEQTPRNDSALITKESTLNPPSNSTLASPQLKLGLGYLFPSEYETEDKRSLENKIQHGDGLAALSLGVQELQAGQKQASLAYLERALILGQTQTSLILARHFEMEGDVLNQSAWSLIAQNNGYDNDGFRPSPSLSYGANVRMNQLLERINTQRRLLGKGDL